MEASRIDDLVGSIGGVYNTRMSDLDKEQQYQSISRQHGLKSVSVSDKGEMLLDFGIGDGVSNYERMVAFMHGINDRHGIVTASYVYNKEEIPRLDMEIECGSPLDMAISTCVSAANFCFNTNFGIMSGMATGTVNAYDNGLITVPFMSVAGSYKSAEVKALVAHAAQEIYGWSRQQIE